MLQKCHENSFHWQNECTGNLTREHFTKTAPQADHDCIENLTKMIYFQGNSVMETHAGLRENLGEPRRTVHTDVFRCVSPTLCKRCERANR